MNLILNAGARVLLILLTFGVSTNVKAMCIAQTDRLSSYEVMQAACREQTGMEAISILMDGYGILFNDSDEKTAQNEALKIIQTAQRMSQLPAPASKDVKRLVYEDKTPGVCLSHMHLDADSRIILTTSQSCSKELQIQLPLIAGEWLTLGENGGLNGGVFDFSKTNVKGLPQPDYQTFEEESTVFWNRLCDDKFLAKYKEICKTNLTPPIYQTMCENEEVKKKSIVGFAEEQKQQTIREVLENGFKMAVTSVVENKTMTDESILNVERLTTRPNGEMEVEFCPKKEELADMVIIGLRRGHVYKTKKGFVVELMSEIENFLKEYATKAKQQGEKND